MAPERIEPLDIIQKKFTRSRRGGYEEAEVDGFMDGVRESMEGLKQEAQVLRQQIGDRHREIAALRDREGAINQTLLMAQGLTEELKRQARTEADIVIGEARLEAERVLLSVADERRDLQADIMRLRSSRARLLGEMRATVDTYARVLDEIDPR